MGNVMIRKGTMRQMVSEDAYNKMYKAYGWIIDEEETPKLDATQEVVKTLKNESEIKHYLKMTKREPKQFNDGLFKSDAHRG